MRIFYTKAFIKELERLPEDIQLLFLVQEEILNVNWRDPRLHTKKLHGKPITFSFRITRSYRVLFYFRAFDEVTFFAVAHRKESYRKISG